ncbi:MAG TPA: tRNA glutamyl-Q(34) synthetase GluQRS [Devosia sp.]|jgi:glutamyl-Q tRNA(Asp) synthetase|nr:tRNA glutamyl-Q(34) synthetase GluQRS [Devosia sp.]
MPILRFAPSPNGYLHLGHAYSALFTDFWARRLGGRFLLRLEDTDTTRCKPEFAAAIYEDLHWLGLDWPEPVLVQSQRFPVYAAAADRLRTMGLLYDCDCTRQEIAARATGTDPDGAPLYDGKCRIHGPAGGRPVQTRLDLGRAVALTGPLSFTVAQPTPLDRPQIRYARPERWGDVVLQRKDVPASYHLAVVVDDAAQAITHVTRGRDMEPSTDIHVLLQMLLGYGQPIYTFHKVLLDASGKKLSKSRNSPSLRDLRAAGRTPESIWSELGF